MDAVKFEQSNARYGPPEGMEESQVRSIHAHRTVVDRGSCEGLSLVVVAYRPDERELARIQAGEPIYVTMLGGLMPHYLSTSFEEATKPA